MTLSTKLVRNQATLLLACDPRLIVLYLAGYLAVLLAGLLWNRRRSSDTPVMDGINNPRARFSLPDAGAPLREGILAFLRRVAPMQVPLTEEPKNRRSVVPIGQTVSIEELGECNGRRYMGNISRVRDTEMVLIAQRAAAPDSAIKVTWPDTVL